MRPTPPSQDEQPAWKQGTDLRNDSTGIYTWPPPSLVEDVGLCHAYPSVTTVLDEFTSGGMRFAEHWFTAEYVVFLAEAAKTKTPVEVWRDADNEDGGELVQVPAIDVLMNKLPESEFGRNFGKHWIKKAGPREMRRRANRGSVLHDALEEWAYGVRIESGDVHDYTQTLLQSRGFTLPVEYCEPYVRQLLLWCDRYIINVVMAEAMVLNRTYCYAGTLDSVLQLRDHPELDGLGPNGMVDAKGSKSDQPSHELQGAAYFYAEELGVPGTAETVPMPKLDWMANLYVQEEKVTLRYWPRVVRCDDPNDCIPMRSFLHARMLWEGMYADEHPTTVRPTAVRAVKPGEPGVPAKLAKELAQGGLPI